MTEGIDGGRDEEREREREVDDGHVVGKSVKLRKNVPSKKKKTNPIPDY